MNMKNIVWLKEVNKDDINIVGGKGAQLGELYNNNFPVPNAFIITTNAYKLFIKKLKINFEQLDKINVENIKQLENISKKIQKKILSASLPKILEKEILAAYSKLQGKVAIRSSATAEDLPTASFAGQQDTYLNVNGIEKVLEAVQKCFASLFTSRAIFYRVQNNFDHSKVSMAVVVQKMVNAKKAGVAFTINPVSNDKKEIVIESVSGLGESLVSGKTTPDSYVVDKKLNKTKEKNIVNKEILNFKEIKALVKICKKIEEHYKFPQDIEWAIDDKLYIVQTRPITTTNSLYPGAQWKKILSREYGVQYTEVSLRSLTDEVKDLVPCTFYEQIYIPEGVNEVCYIDSNKWKNLVFCLEKKWNVKNIEKYEEKFITTGNDYVNFCKNIPKNFRSKSNQELKKFYLDYQKLAVRYTSFIWTAYILNNIFSELARNTIQKYIEKKKSQSYYEIVFSPVKEASILKLSSVINKIPALNKKTIKKVYNEYKWISCLDIHNSPWTIEQFITHAKQMKKSKNFSKKSYSDFLKKFKIKKNDKVVFDVVRWFAYIKDLRDDYRRKAVFYVRSSLFYELARRMGVKISDVSYLLEAEIIDYLDNGNLCNIYKERKKGFVIYFDKNKEINCVSGRDVKKIVSLLGVNIKGSYITELKGVPASKGIVQGKAAIVKGVKDLEKIKKGDILVAVTTHPDYVPAMQKASAIITDEGGITSHAAIVARELRIPCIVGTKNASKVFKEGDKIEVDAEIGLVRLIK